MFPENPHAFGPTEPRPDLALESMRFDRAQLRAKADALCVACARAPWTVSYLGERMCERCAEIAAEDDAEREADYAAAEEEREERRRAAEGPEWEPTSEQIARASGVAIRNGAGVFDSITREDLARYRAARKAEADAYAELQLGQGADALAPADGGRS